MTIINKKVIIMLTAIQTKEKRYLTTKPIIEVISNLKAKLEIEEIYTVSEILLVDENPKKGYYVQFSFTGSNSSIEDRLRKQVKNTYDFCIFTDNIKNITNLINKYLVDVESIVVSEQSINSLRMVDDNVALLND